MELSLSQVVTTALVNVGLAWTVGALASCFWLKRGAAPWRTSMLRRLSAAITAGLFACALGVALSLWTEAAVMGDVRWLDAGPAFSEMLASTHYGHAGLIAFGILLLAMAAHGWLRRGRAGTLQLGIVAVLMLLVAAARVGISHAFERGPMSIAAGMELLHIAFMSLWAGSVFISGWLVLPAVLANRYERYAGYLASLSGWAAAALAGILVTGAYNAYRALGSPRDLMHSDYGHVLVFKLCCVLAAIVLGGFNRFYGLPAALPSERPSPQVRRGLRIVVAVLRIESLALLAALAAAAVLSNSAPPA